MKKVPCISIGLIGLIVIYISNFPITFVFSKDNKAKPVLASEKINFIKEDSMNRNINQIGSLACKLTDGEQVERKQALQNKIFSMVKKIVETDDGYIFYFKYDDVFLQQLTSYIIAEKQCCPFFRFTFIIHPNRDGLELKITGASGAKALIKGIVDEIQN